MRRAIGVESLGPPQASDAREDRTRGVGRPRKASSKRDQILTTPVGLQIPSGLSFDEWADAGPKIVRVLDTFAWCLGDWLVYGQERFESRYAEAAEKVGLGYQTLRNYAWVARRFEASRRRASLSFQHHAEVASRPPAEQDAWLDRAAKYGWSRNQLRRQLKKALEAEEPARPAAWSPRLCVEEAHVNCWRLAAANASVNLSSWIVSALDEAAARNSPSAPAEPSISIP